MPPRKRAPAKAATKATTRKPSTRKAAAAPATKRSPGRPRLLEIDPELQTKIAGMVELGAFPERAAVAAGISERTHYGWQAKGLEERDRRDAGHDPARPEYDVFLDYVNAIDKATATAELELIKSVRAGGNPGALTLLERRFRDRWAVTGRPSNGPTKPVIATPTNPLGQLAAKQAARAAAGG